MDQYVRCTGEVSLDLAFSAIGGDYGLIDDFVDQLNTSLAVIESLNGGIPTAQQCTTIFNADIIGCVAIYLSPEAVLSFAEAIDSEPPFAGEEQACQTLLILEGDDYTAAEDLSEEISAPFESTFSEGPGRRRAQGDDYAVAVGGSFESSEPKGDETQEEAVSAAISELNAIADSCEGVDPSVLSGIPDIPPPSSAGILKTTVLLAVAVIAVFF